MANSQRHTLALAAEGDAARETAPAPETAAANRPLSFRPVEPTKPVNGLAEEAREAAVAADEPPPFLMPKARPAPQTREGEGERTHFLLAGLASLAWIGGLIALGLTFPQTLSPLVKGPLAIAAFVALLAAPLILIWTAAVILGEARRLLAETRRARALTAEMVAPAAAAAIEAGGLVESLHGQIAEASHAAKQAGERLAGLRDAVAEETELLAQATWHADQTAGKLVASLSTQRLELNTLAVTLEARAAAVTDAMNRQAAMVGDASDLAETQLREAQAGLTARSADLAASASQAVEVSRIAADDLARQSARLEAAGAGVGDQLRALEEGLTGQRAGLVTLSHGLRADQEEFASLAESRSAQLSTLIASAGHEAQSLNEAAAHGAKSVSFIIEQTADRFGELVAAASERKAEFEAAAGDAVAAFNAAGERQRESLGEGLAATMAAMTGAVRQAEEAASDHARQARALIDEINEAAFAAGQSAERTLDERLAEARAIVEDSAKLVDEAASRTAAKLEEAFAGTARSLTELQALATEALATADRLPAEASRRGEEIRASLTGAMEALVASARTSAEETQAIDAAFQDRVRRNYEMLSEAVKLMGVVAHAGQNPPPLRRARVESPPEPADAPPAADADLAAEDLGLRPRLKFTATAESAASTPPPPPEPNGEWDWKGLSGGLDRDEGRGDGESASPFNAIAAMGIDPAALLTRGRIQEIASAVQAGDRDGARDVVRTLAPAATRRISRRILGDAAFGEMSERFVAQYARDLAAAVQADADGYQAASLLSSDQGRAYLLLDASAVASG